MDEKVYILSDVVIQGSILKGYRHRYKSLFGSYRGETKIEEVVIPTQQIKKIEVEEDNPALTVLAVVVIIGVPIAAFVIMVSQIEH